MNTYNVYLKCGHIITVEADEFIVSYSNISNKIVSYKVKNIVRNFPVFFDTNEIVAVVKINSESLSNDNEGEITNSEGLITERWPQEKEIKDAEV